MAMLAAYFDASGTHDGCPVITISGFIAPVGKWKTFQSKWHDIINKAGLLPNPGIFHMTDFESRKGDYKGWSDAKRLFVLKKLITAIASRVEMAVSTSVVIPDYDKERRVCGFKILVQHQYPGCPRNQGVAHGTVSPIDPHGARRIESHVGDRP
jgi:hypothetical protein